MAFSGEVTDDESGLEKVTDVFGVGGDHDGHRDPVVRRRPQRGDRVMYGTGMEPSRIKATTGRSGAASRAPTATGSPKQNQACAWGQIGSGSAAHFTNGLGTVVGSMLVSRQHWFCMKRR